MLNRFLDALLGPRCALGCGQRIFPKDLQRHLHLDHAGDPRIHTQPSTQGETA